MEDESVERFFRSVFAWLQAQLGSKASMDDVLRRARRVADEVLGEMRPSVTWADAEPTTVRRLRSPEMVYRPVRLTAHIHYMETPDMVVFMTRDGAQDRTLATSLLLQDDDGDRIGTLVVTGETLVKRVESLCRAGGEVELLGRVLTLPSGDGLRYHFVLEVVDARATASTLDLLGATAVEREEVRALRERLAAGGQSPIDYLFGEVVTGLDIVGLDDLECLRHCLRFVVLQAVSGGRLGHTHGKLHLLVIGPPAQGKKIVSLAAKALNPRAAEISAARVSSAGLVGSSYLSGAGWQSEPGILPRASGGVALFQDSHALTASQVQKLGPLFQELIEDGALRDAKAGGVRREVEVGLVLDANRTSQVRTSDARRREAPILTLRPLLSRLDLIVEIPPDPDRAWSTTSKMYGRQRSGGAPLEQLPWVRRARLLVGELRDRHPVVDLAPVHGHMRRAHETIAAENRHLFSVLPDAGDLPARMANSFAKYVVASARCADRDQANEADVAEALTFLRLKLQFHSVVVPASAGSTSGEDRRRWYGRHAGAVVRPGDLAREYVDETGAPTCERTVRRDLLQLGARYVGKGRYQLPPPAEDDLADVG